MRTSLFDLIPTISEHITTENEIENYSEKSCNFAKKIKYGSERFY